MTATALPYDASRPVPTAGVAGPTVDGDAVTFVLPVGDWVRARLLQEADPALGAPELAVRGGYAEATVPFAGLRRVEYRYELTWPDAVTTVQLDPANPRRAAGPFGERSVVELAGYAAPRWLGHRVQDAPIEDLRVPCQALNGVVPVRVWSPPGSAPSEPMPLLVVQDGVEMDDYAQIGRFAAAVAAAGRVPPCRLALVHPVHREDWYTAFDAFANAVGDDVLPAVRAQVSVVGPIVGLGASLGGLATLLTHLYRPDVFGGLFLQSGSFFLPPQVGGLLDRPPLRRITEDVRAVHLQQRAARPVPVVLTCGVREPNLGNNRAMALSLMAQGFDASLVELPDGHGFTAWRDAWDPALVALLARLWRRIPTPR